MTPNDIDILLHYYTTINSHPRLEAPAVRESIDGFLKDGILDHCNADPSQKHGLYYTTERGNALVALLCSTPYPAQAWIDKDGKIIDVY